MCKTQKVQLYLWEYRCGDKRKYYHAELLLKIGGTDLFVNGEYWPCSIWEEKDLLDTNNFVPETRLTFIGYL